MGDSRVEKAADRWTIRKARGRAIPYDSAGASIIGPSTDAVEVVLAADLAAAEKRFEAANTAYEEKCMDLAAAEKEIERLEFNNSSLRMDRDAVEHNRKVDNQTLLDRAEAAEASLKQAKEMLEKITEVDSEGIPVRKPHTMFMLAADCLAALSSSGGERPAVKSFADIVNLSREFPCPQCQGRRVPCDLCKGYRVDPAKVDLPSGGEGDES